MWVSAFCPTIEAQAGMRILELENRCAGNRTVGSNPTLSAKGRCWATVTGGF